MTGYEIMWRNVQFAGPKRVGLRFDSLGTSDVYRIFVQLPRNLRLSDDEPRMRTKPRVASGQIDEWGCRWNRVPGAPGGDLGIPTGHPLSEWSQLDSYSFPDPAAPGRFDGLCKALEEAEDRYVQLNSPFCLFERMHFLRGFGTLMRDLYVNPEQVKRLADRVLDYQIGIVEEAYRLGRGRIHCFDTTDDWGTQHGLMIKPAMWREYFKPRYKRLVSAVHDAGMHLRFHTDGKVNALFDDFVDLGVDLLNVHQPRLLGIKKVGERLRGRICLEVSVDVQKTLPSGNRQAIQNEVRELVRHWATTDSGLVGTEYRHVAAIGGTLDALRWELEAFRRYGRLAR